HRRASAGQHLVQHPWRADRLLAARRDRVLLDIAARCTGDWFVFARKATGRNMTVLVSVVVPTYKRPELLRRCLAALLAQDYDPLAYEIIIADDAACHDIRRLVDDFATHERAVAYPEAGAAELV